MHNHPYGYPPGHQIPAVFCGSSPGQARDEQEALRKIKEVLKGSVEVSDLSPHIHAPLNSKTITRVIRAVVNIDAADNAAANAAGIALHAANNAYAVNPTILVTAPAGAPSTPMQLNAASYLSPGGYVTIVDRWRARVVVGDVDAVEVSLAKLVGPNFGSTPPDPLFGSGQGGDWQDTMVVVRENSDLIFSVANYDAGAPAFVEIAWVGWQVPVFRFEGTVESLLNGAKNSGLRSDSC